MITLSRYHLSKSVKTGWVVKLKDRMYSLRAKLDGWFIDREFFMRANGQIKFLTVTADRQRKAVKITATVSCVTLLVIGGLAINQVAVSYERNTLSSQQAKVQSAEERIAKYRESIGDVTSDLENRQKVLETLVDQHFDGAPIATKSPPGSSVDPETAKADKISAAIPEAAPLVHMEARQIRFARQLTTLAEARARKAEAQIRRFGLSPAIFISGNAQAQGGPYIPFFTSSRKLKIGDPRFTRLAKALSHMDAMEASLGSIPTSAPAAIMMMSSGFGYRADPFTGGGAMHNGLDFKGPHGTAILAAADGVVSYASGMGGYGNCIEITHANGLITRYAHLSSFNVSLGQKVDRGIQIARMGSTGRSTGTHLHFEVRLNGQAINPRKFLEANSDVLKVQASNAGVYSASTGS